MLVASSASPSAAARPVGTAPAGLLKPQGWDRGQAPGSALHGSSGGQPEPHRQPWPGCSAGEVRRWGFLGLLLSWGPGLGSLGGHREGG